MPDGFLHPSALFQPGVLSCLFLILSACSFGTVINYIKVYLTTENKELTNVVGLVDFFHVFLVLDSDRVFNLGAHYVFQ